MTRRSSARPFPMASVATLLGVACAALGCGDGQPETSRAAGTTGGSAVDGGSSGMPAMGAAGTRSSGGEPPMMVPEQAPPRSPPGSCGLDQPAFCEDFETPKPGGRSGDLDESRFSFARWGHETRMHFVRIPATTEPDTLFPSVFCGKPLIVEFR